MSYQKELLEAGLSQEQIMIIENTTLERVIGDYFTADEHYPLAPVNFLKEWEKEKLVLNGIELHVKGWSDEYLTMADEVVDKYGIYPERIMDSIRQDMNKYFQNLIAVMPAINQEHLVDCKMMEANIQEKIDKAEKMLDEGYYAADILKEINKDVLEENPKMNLNAQIDNSIFILQAAEEKFYNQPITPTSMLHDLYKDMKDTMNDFKDMMGSINKITSKGKAIAQKALHIDKVDTKSR